MDVRKLVMVSCFPRCLGAMSLLNLSDTLGRRDTLDTERYGYKFYSRYSRYKELKCTAGMYICDVITSGYHWFLDS